ncbi:MAG: inositol monophosphatase family protein [Propylenella sp.]
MSAPTLKDVERRHEAAEAVIRDAGRMAADYFTRRERLAITRKGAQDLVSEADRKVEELIVSRLSAAFPADGFLGEEGGSKNLEAEAVWVIDPIDGTHNFLTGIPFWCVSVGLVTGRRAVLGLIYQPAGDELFSARRGAGAFLNGAPIRVSGETEITRARIDVGFSYRRPVADHVRGIEALLSAGCEYLRLGSGALGLAYTAAGRFDGYWERHINAWDAAAGLALVAEARGWTNDFFAGNALMEGNEVLAATPALAEPLARLTGLGSA